LGKVIKKVMENKNYNKKKNNGGGRKELGGLVKIKAKQGVKCKTNSMKRIDNYREKRRGL